LPGAFLGIAETYGLIAEIDAWVVQEAFRFLRLREDAGVPLKVAVNLSARALDDEALLRIIKRQLAQTGVDPACICFEVTESAAILDLDKAKRFISGITGLGCEFSLDDFGVGFSSFSRLKHLPIHELKIDGSFIQNLMHSPVDQHLVRAIVELARGLGMRVVAEFVQDEASVELLRSYGVDLGQGYHLGRPVPVADIPSARLPDRRYTDAAA
jgi:EAL domain-containing protein (putative c-di-GMP-specific phosphodiesterase class I)